MKTFARKLWQHARQLFPVEGFHFDRPIVVLQSDDWGRAGLPDREVLETLRNAGVNLGERPYDFYSLEAADDLVAMQEILGRHHDNSGRVACMVMNFILANLDFGRMKAEDFQQIHLLSLAAGLPESWNRPGLQEAYRKGIAARVFRPALHGMTHFCRTAVERHLANTDDRGNLLRLLWQAGVPYIHWRMPWIGYEYWDSEHAEDERFLTFELQRDSISHAVGEFAKMFATLPRSACAPGYRANDDTHRVWAQYGIRVAQNGPGTLTPPHFDRHGMLHLYRTVEFEPATNAEFSVEACVRRAEECFASGIPAIVSVHSINFHSAVRDFRSRSLELLDEFLLVLEKRHSDLLYLEDEELFALVSGGANTITRESPNVNVTKKKFRKSRVSS